MENERLEIPKLYLEKVSLPTKICLKLTSRLKPACLSHVFTATNHPDVQGNATQTLRIKAAERTETYLVYAGGLALDTNEADIRAHMKDIKIEDVVDVIALKKNKSRYASFLYITEYGRFHGKNI